MGKMDENEKRMQKIRKKTRLTHNLKVQFQPPFKVLIDTNFVNFSIKYKIDLEEGMLKCLCVICIPYFTDCVVAELEKLGRKYHIAAKIAKYQRYKRITCSHSSNHADDCISKIIKLYKFEIKQKLKFHDFFDLGFNLI